MSAEGTEIDMGAVVGSLSQDNRTTMERKGWLKDGKPVENFRLDAVLDSYRGLESLQGKKTLEAPDPANPETFANWEGHKILGVPDKVDGYKFEKPKLPDGLKWSEQEGDGGIKWDAGAETQLRAALLKGKIGQAQATAIFGEMAQARIGEITQARAAREMEAAEVKQNLTRDFGISLKGALELGDQAVKFIAEKAKVDPNTIVDALASKMGNEAATRFAIQLGKMIGEDQLKGGQGQGFATSRDQAQAQIQAFEADAEKTKALFDKANPRHEAVKTEWQRLHKLAGTNNRSDD